MCALVASFVQLFGLAPNASVLFFACSFRHRSLQPPSHRRPRHPIACLATSMGCPIYHSLSAPTGLAFRASMQVHGRKLCDSCTNSQLVAGQYLAPFQNSHTPTFTTMTHTSQRWSAAGANPSVRSVLSEINNAGLTTPAVCPAYASTSSRACRALVSVFAPGSRDGWSFFASCPL